MDALKNRHIAIEVSPMGAELQSIVDLASGRQCLWQGNPDYWRRRSPVLFPIVGSIYDGETRVDGKVYRMGQHGFARDMMFSLVESTPTSLTYALDSNDETRAKLPYDFRLEISYTLVEKTITVGWRVVNTSATDIHFQIGAHPAFNHPDFDPTSQVAGYFRFDNREPLTLSAIGEKGCLKQATSVLTTDDGVLALTPDRFAGDALIFENSQIHSVELLDRNRKPYLRVDFDAPVLGLWAPRRSGHSPFVCIEPWYGRCDRENYVGEFADKDWVNTLAPDETFEAKYTIEIV
ncbi:MAG: aldose 1-epimerase family protein [Candidatus Limisoma sp.]